LLSPSPPDPGTDPPPTVQRARRAAVAGAALTLAMAAGVGWQLFGRGLDGLTRAVPSGPLFYLAFAASYLALPVADWLILRRLWGGHVVGAAGLAATLRKRVANEVVLGYSGEAYVYAWARANGIVAPFAAVKDVAVLSAVAGNLATLTALGLALPLAGHLPAATMWGALGSALLVAAATLPFLFWRRRVFALPGADLRWVLGVHLARQLAATLLLAATWSLGRPGIAAGLWLALAAGRLVVWRLPFVPNKDLLFANLAALLIGRGDAVADLIAFTAALTLLVHAALMAAFGLGALVRRYARTAASI